MSSDPSGLPGSHTTNYRKYQTANPLMQGVLSRFLERICTRIESRAPKRILDIGCGEGLVVKALRERGLTFDYLGLDLNPDSVHLAAELNPGLRFEVFDLLQDPLPGAEGDLVLCLEVVEHLPDSRAALERICACSSDQVMVSVPWEPYFQLGNFLRGKYWRTLGNHPEHIQKFTPATFTRLLRGCGEDAAVETCFPWLIGTLSA